MSAPEMTETDRPARADRAVHTVLDDVSDLRGLRLGASEGKVVRWRM